MKKIFALAFAAVMAFAETLNIDNFETDLYSRDAKSSIKKVSVSLRLEGRDVVDNEAYVLDALNVVVGSFYVEDILTSMGKEKFKELFMKYAAKKHSLDIDDVLILNIKVINNLELSEIIKAIKSQNLCSDPSVNEDVMTKPEKKKKGNEIIVAPDPNDVVQKPIDLNNVQEFGKDFGEK